MIGKDEVPPGMLGGDRSPESQEGPPWSLRKSGWTCMPYIATAGASAPWPASSLNRRTVRRELAAGAPPGYPPRALRYPFTPAQLAHIDRRLAVCPSLRATDLHHELQIEYGYAGSYSTCRRQLA